MKASQPEDSCWHRWWAIFCCHPPLPVGVQCSAGTMDGQTHTQNVALPSHVFHPFRIHLFSSKVTAAFNILCLPMLRFWFSIFHTRLKFVVLMLSFAHRGSQGWNTEASSFSTLERMFKSITHWLWLTNMDHAFVHHSYVLTCTFRIGICVQNLTICSLRNQLWVIVYKPWFALAIYDLWERTFNFQNFT